MRIPVGNDLLAASDLHDEDDTRQQKWRVCAYNLERVVLHATIWEWLERLPPDWVRVDLTLAAQETLLRTTAWSLTLEDTAGDVVATTTDPFPFGTGWPYLYAQVWEGPRAALAGVVVRALTHRPPAPLTTRTRGR